MMISIVVCMYNEEANVFNTLNKVKKVTSSLKYPYEIVVVNDGSKDKTLLFIKEFALKNDNIIYFDHKSNRGLGAAMKTAFSLVKGDLVIPVDADLSYDATYIKDLVKELEDNPTVDIVTLSPYMKGGVVKNVSFIRLLVSKVGNRFLSFAMSTKLRTVSCMVRGYRRNVIDSLDLDSNGAEIQVEILAKASALGYRTKEIPAMLKGRVAGTSNFKYASGISKHVLMSLYEKPMILFGFFGIFFLIFGLILGSYIASLALSGNLIQGRAIVILDELLILSGFLMFFFGFISNQLVILKKEVYKVQKENSLLAKNLKK